MLKAVLIDFFGATLSLKGIPQTPTATGEPKDHGHLPGLWPEVAVQAGGRDGAQFIALLTATNPFAGWNIADRYADGSMITQQCAKDHLAIAMNVAQIHEQAILNGSVP